MTTSLQTTETKVFEYFGSQVVLVKIPEPPLPDFRYQYVKRGQGCDFNDAQVEEFIRQHPDGASLSEIADHFKTIGKSAIAMMLSKAIRKCKKIAIQKGLNPDDFDFLAKVTEADYI